jgi:hypothetical protein
MTALSGIRRRIQKLGLINPSYATSLLCVERLFRALKPKLLMMKVVR